MRVFSNRIRHGNRKFRRAARNTFSQGTGKIRFFGEKGEWFLALVIPGRKHIPVVAGPFQTILKAHAFAVDKFGTHKEKSIPRLSLITLDELVNHSALP